MILQLNPTIPVHTEKGNGYAIAWIDYSQEHSLQWIVVLDSTGEVWSIPNEKIKVQWNYSLGRVNHNYQGVQRCL